MTNLWREYRKSLPRNLRYFLLLFLFGATQCDKSDTGDIVSIPDANFLNEIIHNGVDTNGDGRVSYEEAEACDALFLGPSNIKELSGIEAFIKLDTLVVEVNPISPPDFSANTALRYLTLAGCGLTELDISKNGMLKHLECTGDEGLGSFLETLDLSGNPELETLICGGNELSRLDLSNNPLLLKVSVSRNRIPELDLSANLLLSELKCTNNLLKKLNLRVNTTLVTMVSCGNQLSTLDLSQNTKLRLIGFDNMPSMGEVCVWALPFPPEGVKVLMEFSPNAFFTTTCSN